MVATRSGTRVESPSSAASVQAPARAEVSPTHTPARRTRRAAMKDSQSEANSDSQHDDAEDPGLGDLPGQLPSSTAKRIARTASRQPRRQGMGSANEAEVSEAESCSSAVSASRGSRRNRVLLRDLWRPEEADVSEAESCSSSVSAATRRSTRNLRTRVCEQSQASTERPNEEAEISEVESCCSDTLGMKALGTRRVTRSRRSVAPSGTAPKPPTEDAELSEAESCTSGVSGLQGSALRRSARTRKGKNVLPLPEFLKEEGNTSATSSVSSPRRRTSRASKLHQELECADVGSPKRATLRQTTSKVTQEEMVISDSESDISVTCLVPGSPASRRGMDIKPVVASKSPSSSRTGSGSSRQTMSPPGIIAEEEAELPSSPAASPSVPVGAAKVSEGEQTRESKLVQIVASPKRTCQSPLELACPTEKPTTLKAEERMEEEALEKVEEVALEKVVEQEALEKVPEADEKVEEAALEKVVEEEAEERVEQEALEKVAEEEALEKVEERMEEEAEERVEQEALEKVAEEEALEKVEERMEEEAEEKVEQRVEEEETMEMVERSVADEGPCSTAQEPQCVTSATETSLAVSLLLSSGEDEDEGESSFPEAGDEKEGSASDSDDEAGPSTSQTKTQLNEKHSALEDDMFIIDTRPGFQTDTKYYLDAEGEDEAEESEQDEVSDKEVDQGEESEEFIDEEDDETEILYKSKNPALADLSSSIDPGLNMKEFGGLCVNLEGGKKKAVPNPLKKLKEKRNQDELLKNSVITPDFEKKDAVPPYQESKRQLKLKRKEEKAKTTGDGWYNMKAPELTEELKNDLKALKMRSAMDPKRFYKKNDREGFPKYFQVGTVVDTPVDFYHARIPKKQRKRTIVEELIADAEFRSYNKKKYKQILVEKADLSAGKKNRKKNKFRKK
ncbi:deoxynucleotidyltransferase terminal-interacting protein 2 [Amia ocellicauda]|uniref:deoxynucleotidyltransferase terminal-interacting protein 2 n=1 Tax=Amia ocellicauda TaxID=2972642 RepID=UPI003464C114